MIAAIPATLAQADELVLRDSLELGFDQAYRNDTLALRDPHVFVNVQVLGCVDFTDTPIPLTDISLNNQLTAALNGDADSDTFLDLSPIITVDLLDASGIGQMLTQFNAQCLAPAPAMNCTVAPPLPPTVASDNLDSGICLQALAATTSGYTPPVPQTQAPCWVSDEVDLTVPFGDLAIPLTAARSAYRWVDSGVSLDNGLISGFLRESDADQLLLPADLPLIGGQPLSIILPGGNGNCAAGDDRDTFNGESGWWFYFSATALPVQVDIAAP
ncbi:MAG: hypothetical protein Tsb002_10930 [Wenzhouxiangellaceae bacterium]